ncbi:MAG: DUF2851 family protein [Chitinophagaceae bacterium]|nr:DUF2851 family protein [Chitinophagaceae bacterium]
MTEKLLQFIWQFQYFSKVGLFTTKGESIQIKSVGTLNQNQGPDFLNAQLIIGEIIWHGNIELHTHSSLWKKHTHHTDTNYNNVILHVVWVDDEKLITTLPVLELQHKVSKVLLNHYEELMNQKEKIACNQFLPALSGIGWMAWKERLATERLIYKSEEILQLLTLNNNNWEETFWQQLAYNFGLKTNASFFMQIAQSLPITILSKNKNNILLLEALLLGQANLLNGNFVTSYPIQLQKEFRYLKKKYKLKDIEGSTYFLRMRPHNFPTIRLVQLAALIQQSKHLFSQIKSMEKIEDVKKLFAVSCSEYWNKHYTLLDKEKPDSVKMIGNKMIDLILINTIIPTVFAIGYYNRDDYFKKKAINWLQQIKSESNSIINKWNEYKIANKTAFDSQALIQLTNHYCKEKKCLNCAVAVKILQPKSIIANQ